MTNGKVVLITGCSSGIGRELCSILAGQGYVVAATARNAESLKDLPVSIKLPLDVTKKESVDAAVSEIIARFQKIDILVNNAGYSMRGALEEICPDGMKELFDVNVFGIVNMIQAILPGMRKNKSGKIINIGSISGRFTQPINGAYCASKHAVEALSDALRLELCGYNIQSTVIEPGPVQTNFFKTMAVHSSSLMENPDSCYANYYKKDSLFRSRQNYAAPTKAAETICGIIGRERLKPRYQVAVPFVYRMMICFPDTLRENLQKRLR